jgi:hypothetical protein
VPVPVPVPPAGEEVTVYPVIALPPSDEGTVKLTVAWALPAAAITPVGAPGTVGAVGVTAVEAAEGTELPTAFVATTVKVYGVPFVNPVAVIEVPVPVQVTGTPPVGAGEEVTV